ncbi:MAG: hypothetical protein AAF311_08665 [Pseudomonadota bacterium]
MSVIQLDNYRTHTTPLASAVRIGDFHRQYSDFHSLDLLSDKRAVVDACNVSQQSDLLAELRANGYEIILDTQAAELACAFKWNGRARGAEWLTSEPDGPLLNPQFDLEMAHQIAALAVKAGAHVILAPSRYLSATAALATLRLDFDFLQVLRTALDRSGATQTAIASSFIGRLTLLGDDEVSETLTSLLSDSPVTSVWMRLSGLKRDPAPGRIRTSARRLSALKDTGLPVVLDYAAGLEPMTLLSLGAASGISFGAMKNDQFSDETWIKPIKSPSNSLDEETGRKQYVRAPSLGRNFSQAELQLLADAPKGKRILLDPSNTGLSTYTDLKKRAKEVALRETNRAMSQLSATPNARRTEHIQTYILKPAARKAEQLAALKLDVERAASLKVDADSLSKRLATHASQVRKTCDMINVVQNKQDTRASAPIPLAHLGETTMPAHSEDRP